MIAAKLPQASVLDLFAGSGNLGLEALSRGAASAVFVDNNRQSQLLIDKNIKRCGFIDQTTVLSASAVHEPLFLSLNTLVNQEKSLISGFDLVFLDPPYGQGLAQKCLNLLAGADFWHPGAVIVTEEAENVMITLPEGWRMIQSRSYGDTRLTIGTR